MLIIGNFVRGIKKRGSHSSWKFDRCFSWSSECGVLTKIFSIETFSKYLFLWSVAQAYLNEKKLDHEARQLQQNAANFSRQAQQWLQMVENFSSALKEVGDVENWAKSIEKDLKIAETALEYAYKVGPSNNPWMCRI